MQPGWAIALAIIAAVGAGITSMTPMIAADTLPGLLAGEQRLAGRGNSLTENIFADPSRLDRDVRTPVTWWAPGQQQIVYALRVSGVSLGATIKLIVVAAWLVGLIAWAILLWLALDDKRLAPWLIGAFALFRMSHSSGFTYTGGETLLWSMFPVSVLLTLLALHQRSTTTPFAVAAGLSASTLVILKYSAALLAASVGVLWLLMYVHRRPRIASGVACAAGVAAGLGLVYKSGVFDLITGSTPISTSLPHSSPVVIAWSLSAPFLALADIVEAGTTAARQLGYGPLSDAIVGALSIGVGIAMIGWVYWTRQLRGSARNVTPVREQLWWLAVTVMGLVSTTLAVLLLRGADISWEARHHQYGAFLMMPFFADSIYLAVRQGSARLKRVAVAYLLFFLVLPTLYGAMLLAKNVFIHTTDQQSAVTPNGVHLLWSRDGAGAEALVKEVSGVAEFRPALLAAVSSRIALSFPGQRAIIVRDPRLDTAQRYAGIPPGGVAVLLPPGLEAADTRVLLQSFPDATSWTSIPLQSVPRAQLWIGR